MSENKYLELCNRVYSHIQSKEIREYYLNEIKDSIEPQMLLTMIKFGYYSIENKFVDYDDFFKIADMSLFSEQEIAAANEIKHDFEISKEYYFINNNIILIGNCYDFYTYDDIFIDNNISDTPLYGTSMTDILTAIRYYKTDSVYDYDDALQCGYIDKILLDKPSAYTSYVRFRFSIIDGNIVITDGADANIERFSEDDHTYDILNRYPKYPFKNGDRIKFELPSLSIPIRGVYRYEPDYSGVPYMWLYDDEKNEPILDLALMYESIFLGYLMTDWITREE